MASADLCDDLPKAGSKSPFSRVLFRVKGDMEGFYKGAIHNRAANVSARRPTSFVIVRQRPGNPSSADIFLLVRRRANN
ncbi:MAG: hypothetical protein JW925_12140 [Syntrophaceae bacterium]|nr:hypothetical protein [Syntrophaceae bacterium]